jgi:peroxiredoxin
MKRNKVVIFVVSLIGICLIIFCVSSVVFISNFQDLYDAFLDTSSLQVGSVAPDFELNSVNGETIRLSDNIGQPVILTIGATWCVDCVREAPLLQTLHETHPEIFMLMVDVKESKEEIINFKNKYGITYEIAMDYDGSVYNQYRVIAIPTLFFIDKSGVIKARIIESVNEDTLDELLREVGIIK